ncbi:hypothetical protein PVC01_050019600 [Plasmodium vivax]|uniref:(malaria parasite P. vivax) hypothetical protein n=1 Tax=Plasmodium vivax TaxID=5855 RepID=A0A1G4H8W2_PLAVI|nr:unnamed protein product [Plasmodium vivax]SCO65902.1 hypothetical protein PVT01_050020500 [Plasmodium vivax]SCO71330.1 hypothetical protein PVC01_050019600 [Plasmodium vivax]
MGGSHIRQVGRAHFLLLYKRMGENNCDNSYSWETQLENCCKYEKEQMYQYEHAARSSHDRPSAVTTQG